MGLLGKLFGEKKEELKVEKIEYSKLPDWLAKHRKVL